MGRHPATDQLDIHPSLITCLLFVVSRAAGVLTNAIALGLGDVVVASIVSVRIGLR